jgi:hypothetical protein
MKTVLHVVIILLVIGVVCGGIYLAVEKGAVDSLFQGGIEGNHFMGAGSADGGRSAQINGNSFNRGEPPEGGRFEGGEGLHGGASGLSSRSWIELGAQAGKIAIITAFVALIQGLISLIKRRKVTASTTNT